MAVLEWDKTGNEFYETGTDRGVLYPYDTAGKKYGKGVAWDGLRSFNESPSGAEETALYANNHKYGSLRSAEDFDFTLGAYTSPEEFDECDGAMEIANGVYATQQNRKMFGFSVRTLVGNDTENTDFGYKIHLCYGCTAAPTSRDHSTTNDSPEAEELSWECKTNPIAVPDGKPSAHIIIRSWVISKAALKAVEDKLYGTANSEPTLPLPAELIALIKSIDGVEDTFVGDGTTTDFTLTETISGNPTSVTVGGEPIAEYTVADNTISFTTAPADGAEIVVKYKISA